MLLHNPAHLHLIKPTKIHITFRGRMVSQDDSELILLAMKHVVPFVTEWWIEPPKNVGLFDQLCQIIVGYGGVSTASSTGDATLSSPGVRTLLLDKLPMASSHLVAQLLHSCTKLSRLKFRFDVGKVPIPKHLRDSLHHLWCRWDDIEDTAVIGTLTLLESLSLEGTRTATTRFVTTIANLAKLTSLRLVDFGQRFLAHVPLLLNSVGTNLTALDLSCDRNTPGTLSYTLIEAIVTHCPKLQYLALENYHSVPIMVPLRFLSSLPELRGLNLCGTNVVHNRIGKHVLDHIASQHGRSAPFDLYFRWGDDPGDSEEEDYGNSKEEAMEPWQNTQLAGCDPLGYFECVKWTDDWKMVLMRSGENDGEFWW
ncbi:hypothetical protein HDU93_000343 [Gonapodya sp. JEL0774]|nr:hypothetical protein HDU93_000343 [Gonapodya sp. JEL0774]